VYNWITIVIIFGMNIPDIIGNEDLTQHLFLHYLEKGEICFKMDKQNSTN